MADFSVSISNSLNSFGPAPATRWGTGSPYTMTWGTSKWGEGTEDLIASIEKLISNSILSDSELFKAASKFIENSIIPTSETTNEGLQDGSGYSYVFTAPTLDGESRNLTTYASGTAQGTAYSSASVAVTNWS